MIFDESAVGPVLGLLTAHGIKVIQKRIIVFLLIPELLGEPYGSKAVVRNDQSLHIVAWQSLVLIQVDAVAERPDITVEKARCQVSLGIVHLSE